MIFISIIYFFLSRSFIPVIHLFYLLFFSGWEYTVEASLGGFGPVEKRYHMCRRRRWVRSRKLVVDVKKLKEKVTTTDFHPNHTSISLPS